MIPGLGRSPGGELGNPLQYSCLENPMDSGAWWATVHESDMTKATEHMCFSLNMCNSMLCGLPKPLTGLLMGSLGPPDPKTLPLSPQLNLPTQD